jgi:hypothetical protein
MGLTEADLSDYANFKADQSKAVNAVMEARNWPANVVSEAHVADIMTPLPGEGRNYGNRVVHDLAQIDAQVQNYKNALQQGQTTAPLTIQYPNSSQPVPAGTGAAGGVLANQTSNSAAAPANTGINDIPGTGNDSGKTTRNPNITDENIAYTMKANNMTRAQVIAELKRRNMM